MAQVQVSGTQNYEILKKQIIIPYGGATSWLRGRAAVSKRGGLPSNILHDYVLVNSEYWKLLKSYYPAWSREVLVYPEKNGEFKRDKDVIDAFEDHKGREWIFLASSIPEVAIGRKGVGLFVDPVEVEHNDRRVVIHADPKSITVLTPFIQISGQMGSADPVTRIPLYVDETLRGSIANDQKRSLERNDGPSVRPIVRGCGGPYGRRCVDAVYYGMHRKLFGAASVGIEGAIPAMQTIALAPKRLETLIRDANRSMEALHGKVKDETLIEPIRTLIHELEQGLKG